MSHRDDSIGPYQPLPFTPALFYAVPRQWLTDVRETGDLDTRQLLLAMNNGTDALVVFPPALNEAHWTRSHSKSLPNVVSHPTYQRYLCALIKQERLQVMDGQPPATQVYVLIGWPHFDGTGRFFVPRAYIERRWPAWLGQSQWAPRAALLSLLDKLATEESSDSSAPGQPLEVSAYVKDLSRRAQTLLPSAQIAGGVSSGLLMLTDLGLITEVSRSRANRSYRLRTDAFDQPPSLPLAKIATQCGLDMAMDRPWLVLIQAFLRHNFWPVARSAEVLAVIRRYLPGMMTHDAAQTIGRLLEERATPPSASRKATHPNNLLKDYVAQQRRPWRYGAEFNLSLISSASSEPGLWLPVASSADIDTTQLMVHPIWTGRLRHEDVLALLQDTRWFLYQPIAPYMERRIELLLLRRLDRDALTDGIFLDGNHLHAALDYTLPFRVAVEPARAQPRLTLHCQFRVLLGRTAAVERQIASQRGTGSEGQSTYFTPQVPDPL